MCIKAILSMLLMVTCNCFAMTTSVIIVSINGWQSPMTLTNSNLANLDVCKSYNSNMIGQLKNDLAVNGLISTIAYCIKNTGEILK